MIKVIIIIILITFTVLQCSLVISVLPSIHSISLIEPGPVITEFERKVYDEGLKTDLSKADKVTADMFTNIYLKNYKQIFETLGQSAEDIAEVYCCSSTNILQFIMYYINLQLRSGNLAFFCTKCLCWYCVLFTSILSRSSPWKTHLSAIRQMHFTPLWPHSNMLTPMVTSQSTHFTKWFLSMTRSSMQVWTSSSFCGGEVERALPWKKTRATSSHLTFWGDTLIQNMGHCHFLYFSLSCTISFDPPVILNCFILGLILTSAIYTPENS